MCTRVTCKTCGRPSYAGCGRHIEAVLGDVPVDGRCRCRERRAADEKAAPPAGATNWLSSIFAGKPRP